MAHAHETRAAAPSPANSDGTPMLDHPRSRGGGRTEGAKSREGDGRAREVDVRMVAPQHRREMERAHEIRAAAPSLADSVTCANAPVR